MKITYRKNIKRRKANFGNSKEIWLEVAINKKGKAKNGL
jgi:hypothetical protein